MLRRRTGARRRPVAPIGLPRMRQRPLALSLEIARQIRPCDLPPATRGPRYANLYDTDNLETAFTEIRQNGSRAPGYDGITPGQFNRERRDWIHFTAGELRCGTFRLEPVLATYKKKPDGSTREIGIPTVRDRMVARAVLNELYPHIDNRLSPDLYAHRPGRGLRMARQAAALLATQFRYVLRIDLSNCFGRVPHERLQRILAAEVDDPHLLALLVGFMRTEVIRGDVLHHTAVGLNQGTPVSPFLTAAFLDRWVRRTRDEYGPIIGYGDDFLVFSSSRNVLRRW